VSVEILIVVLLVSGVVFPFLYFSLQRKNRNLENFIQQQRKNAISARELREEREVLNHEWSELDAAHERLAPIEAEEELVIAVGSLQFEFDDSDKYKEAISSLKSQQKEVVRGKRHIEGPTLSYNGDKKFHTKLVKLVLLAYNAAADDARHSVKWNNYERIMNRFDKQRETINSLTPLQITKEFHDLKVREIIYTYHREELRQKEKEERKELQAQMREEAKAEREIEQARKQAERDAKIAAKAVADAEARLASASEQERAGFKAQLELLQQQLLDANSANTRALSMAQQTRRGHVYVISNVGSFGENVYKVGMTRRLIPEERVKDLSDASVPFPFDIHAMIEAEDAPALESELHRMLGDTRVNRINKRKEFFNVRLSEIKNIVRQFSPGAEFIDFAEAREYRETLGYSQSEASPQYA